MIEEEVEDLEELGEDEPEQEQEMYEHFRLEVDPGQNLLRIDRFLVDRLPNVSRKYRKLQKPNVYRSIINR